MSGEPDRSDFETPFSSLYDRAVDTLLDVPVSEEWVTTAPGRTHLLTAGDPDDPPVVVFQGGNVTNPVTLSWFQTLSESYYLVAPDTPGEPGKSDRTGPDAYGQWVVDVLDELGIERAAMVGPSHGAGVLLEAATVAPDRISAAALVVPAGFGTPLSLPLVHIGALSVGYRLVPHRRLLDRALAPMVTESPRNLDPVVVETIGTALRTSDLKTSFPGPDDLGELTDFDAPAIVVTGERDPFFPGIRTCKRAARALPGLAESVLLANERHFLSARGQARATDRVRSFLATRYR